MSTIKNLGGIGELSDILIGFEMAFPNATKIITNFTGALQNGEGIIAAFKGGLSGLWGVISAHPILAIIAALGLLYVAINKIKETLPNAENTAKWLKESSEEVKSIQSDVDNLNNELSTTQTRIDELLAKDSLTIVEQNELEKLQKTNTELDRQIKLRERALKVAQTKNSTNFVQAVNAKRQDNFTNLASDNDTLMYSGLYEMATNKLGYDIGDANDMETYYKVITVAYEEAEKEYLQALNNGNEEEAKSIKERKERYEAQMNEYVSSLNEYKEQLGEYDYATLSDKAKEQLDYIQDVENKYFTTIGDSETVFDNIFNSERFSKAKEAIGELDEVTSATLRTLYESNPDVRAMIDNMKDVGLITGSVGNSLEYLANQINGVDENGQSLNDTIEDVEDSADGLKDTIKELSTALDDMQKANKTISEIADNYSKNGFYSTDDIQSFLSLDKEYINLLIDENGQINLNNQAYKEYVASKAKSLLVNELQDLYSSILGMKVEEAQAYANAKAYNEETRSVQDLLTATTQLYYAKAMAQDSANNTTAYTDAMSRSFNTAANYAAMVDSYINSLSTSQNEFNHVTNKTTDSTNEYKDALEAEKDALEDAKDSLEDYKDELSEAQSSLKDLIDLVTDYIKQMKEEEKSALEDQISTLDKQKDALDESKDKYDELIEKRKEAIKAAYDEKKAQDELLDKQKSVAKDRLALEVAGLDDSSAGRKAQKQARDNLAESEKSLHEYQDERSYDFQIKELEDFQTQLEEKTEKRKAQIDSQVEHIESKIDEIDKYLDNSRQLYEDACAMIDNDNGTLYSNLWNYTYTYTTQTKAEFDHLWASAQEALAKYRGDNDSLLEVMETLQIEIYNTEGQISELDSSIDIMNQRISDSSKSIDVVSSSLGGLSSSILDYKRALDELADASNSVNENDRSLDHTRSNEEAERKQRIKDSSNDISNGKRYKWFVKWNDVVYHTNDSVTGNKAIDIFANDLKLDRRAKATLRNKIYHYASGTRSTKGDVSITDENNRYEAKFGKLSSGKYTLMPEGSQVFDAERTDNLYDFSGNPEEFISKLAERGLSLLSGDELSSLGWGKSLITLQLFDRAFNSSNFVKSLTGLSGTTYNNNNSANNNNYTVSMPIQIYGNPDQSVVQSFDKVTNKFKDKLLKELDRLGRRNRKTFC